MPPRPAAATSSAVDVSITLASISCVLLLIAICSCCQRKKGRYKKGAPIKGTPMTSLELTASSQGPSIIVPTSSEILRDMEEAKMAELRKSYWIKRKAPTAQAVPILPVSKKADVSFLKRGSSLHLAPRIQAEPPRKSPVMKSPTITPSSSPSNSASPPVVPTGQDSIIMKKTVVVSPGKKISAGSLQSQGTMVSSSQLGKSVSVIPDLADLDPETQHRLRIARFPTAVEAARDLHLEFRKASDWDRFIEYYGKCKVTAADVAAKRSATMVQQLMSGRSETGQSNVANLSTTTSEASFRPKKTSNVLEVKPGIGMARSAFIPTK